MKYLKDPVSGEVFAFAADGSQDKFIPKELKLMTKAEIEAHLYPQPSNDQLEEIAKNVKANNLSNITVTTQSGKTFDGNETARGDMLVALTVGEWINETQTYWKMANNDTLLVTKDELQEALTLAIQAKGRIVGAIE